MTEKLSLKVHNTNAGSDKKRLDVSVVVPITEFHHDIPTLYGLYADQLNRMGKSFEFIFVLDGGFPDACHQLKTLKEKGKPIKIIKFNQSRGEAAALREGFRQANADVILTLASYIQIEPEEMTKVFAAYEEGSPFVITRRFPRKDPLANRMQSAVYHFLVNALTGSKFKDITSGMRLIKKDIASELIIYGELYQFIPVLAANRGISVEEIKVSQREEDARLRLVSPGAYLRRLLDILVLFFLTRFTTKPLRFFGLIGSAFLLPGVVITSCLGVLRIMGKIGLANRPLLLLGILFIVFGFQVIAVGLIGELILFAHSKEIEGYRIEELIE
jgi:glycosyltransferase involved in cell wall biosynthesis